MDVIPVIIDSDIGDDITDTTALVFALKSSELKIEAILSNNNHEKQRALILDKLVDLAGEDILVFQGVEGGSGALRGQKNFVEDYDGEVKKLAKNVDYIEQLLGKGTKYISDGSLTNPAYLLDEIPAAVHKTEFHVMAGAIDKNYEGENEPVAEWNIDCDIPSARKFFDASLPVNLYPLDCSWDLEITDGQLQQITVQNDPLNRALGRQFTTWREAHERNLVEYDSLLMAAVVKPDLITEWEEMKLTVTKEGRTVRSSSGSQMRVAVDVGRERFTRFFLRRVLQTTY